MKKVLLSGLLAGLVVFSANASDDGFYSETVTTEVNYSHRANVYTYDDGAYVAPKRVVRNHCNRCNAQQPVRVKEYTEVVDHYRVYEPVTVYVPAGTYSERRVCRYNNCAR
ncbi:MAG: hypothetical protein ACLRFI_02745 [Alphaproteobacteria bacterium]